MLSIFRNYFKFGNYLCLARPTTRRFTSITFPKQQCWGRGGKKVCPNSDKKMEIT